KELYRRQFQDSSMTTLPNCNKPLQESNMASLPCCNKQVSTINCYLNFSQVQVPNMNDYLLKASESQLPVTAFHNVNTPFYNKEWSLSLNINCHLNSLQGPALNRYQYDQDYQTIASVPQLQNLPVTTP
ncbi:19825_t:CDS:2, partial [Racocetra persica]